MVEPEPVVDHPSQEVLRRVVATGAAHSTAELTARIEGDAEGRLADEALRSLEILLLPAVVGVNAQPVLDPQGVGAEVLVEDERQVPGGPPGDLQPQPGSAVEAAVRLPAVHDPRLDLQLVTGEDLDPDAIEEPGSVRGDVGGLVGPVVELVVAEETDVGEEDAGV